MYYMSQEILTALITSGVAIIGALTSFIVSLLKSKATKKEIETIKKVINESDKLYYVECPNCKTKIYLDSVRISSEEKE